ncbi:MAG: hypothetical protein NTU44_13240 [Bacteroidetes bacterium]|nr:hypothetical protein [Bacteroidota bacterium]
MPEIMHHNKKGNGINHAELMSCYPETALLPVCVPFPEFLMKDIVISVLSPEIRKFSDVPLTWQFYLYLG